MHNIKDTREINMPLYSKSAGKVSFTLSDPGIAKVNKSGKVKGLKLGSTAFVAEQNGHTATGGMITVVPAPKKVTVKKKKIKLKVGKKYTIKAKVNKGATCGKYTYKSSKKKVAVVSKKGVIKAKSAGKTTITVKSYNGKKVKIKVTVKS